MKKLATIALLSMIAATSYADEMKQDVKICLNVSGNTSPYNFVAKFVSHDVFDMQELHRTGSVNNGQSCYNHVYAHGPKQIKVTLKNEMILPNYVLIKPDESCAFLHKARDGKYVSDFVRSSAETREWNFNITQTAPVDGYRYTYNLSCSYQEA